MYNIACIIVDSYTMTEIDEIIKNNDVNKDKLYYKVKNYLDKV